jgi:hypothetical protein
MRIHFLLIVSSITAFAEKPIAAQQMPATDAEEIVVQMLAHDAQRQASTEGYFGTRRYILRNEQMHKCAKMTVRVKGDPDGTKHFEIVSEEGWKAAQKHVLSKMLESEEETSRPAEKPKTRLSPDNYDFQLVGTERTGDRTSYEIEVTPKRREKYLFHGRIWVDTEDYALVRADGNPAKNPSFWIKTVHFVHTYEKSGEFWFPVTTESVTEARLFGTTNLTIEYFEYQPIVVPRVPETAVEVVQAGGQR